MSEACRNQTLVVIGVSSRMLAVSAVRAGLNPVAVDLFADSDTRSVARCIALSSLEEDKVLSVLGNLVIECGRPKLVYGSGIDTRPALVERILKFADVIGNSPSTLRTVNTPSRFFPLLDSIAIPYPEISFSRPENSSAWVLKMPFMEGGNGVLSTYRDVPGNAESYYQRKLDGSSMSVLFLADRREAGIIGFNTQWTEAGSTGNPYRLSGIMNVAEVTIRQRIQIEEYATKLVKSASLAGLISLDFMIEDGACKVLELNPRPSASMALYDSSFPLGLLNEHIRSFEGLPMRVPNPKSTDFRGLEIVYAQQSCVVRQDLPWPDWTADRPVAGTKIAVGQPLCTVVAKAASGEAVKTLLAQRRQRIYQRYFKLPGVFSGQPGSKISLQ